MKKTILLFLTGLILLVNQLSAQEVPQKSTPTTTKK